MPKPANASNVYVKPEPKGPARLNPLSVLPVFFKLEGQSVLVAGCDMGAEWKVELLCASGALVDWVSASFTQAAKELITRYPDQINRIDRSWQIGDLRSKTLAIGAFSGTEPASIFYDAAQVSGVPVNCIDQRKFCDFQFGSIVSRGPVVVSISTGGAAPILAQTIRQKIETLLPPALAGWAETAKTLRPKLAKKIPSYDQRRRFWQKFSRAAFVRPSSQITLWLEDIFANNFNGVDQESATGRVTLVGAGPGDAELLTIKAMRALQTADVILFDALVSSDVLELARREAKRILIGKRGGKKSCSQDEINALMVKLARQGKHVVRLKSGDPMIFGRAGEEIEILKQKGIPVSVVPGITAAMALASSLGVSLTNRECAQGVKFITAHSKPTGENTGKYGTLPNVDWQACADKATTLMVYMGAKTAPLLAEKLIDEGLSVRTPVVIARGVSRPNSEIENLTLGLLRHKIISFDLPVLIGIGQVFIPNAKAKNTVGAISADDNLEQQRHCVGFSG
ncbi:MAG: uroporphyrinogen-III C-methyltransferase [Robiginitomaculum sp.]|nr:uroporphyrinogen-III C-methyltransferase [Robiginitomaculum sp.]